jgi:hypothetical protein
VILFLEILTALATLCLAWWLFRRLLRPKAPAEPAEEPYSLVPAPRKRGPKGRSAAVALEEPDEDGPADAYPPRAI